jgi:hypothetical protein
MCSELYGAGASTVDREYFIKKRLISLHQPASFQCPVYRSGSARMILASLTFEQNIKMW